MWAAKEKCEGGFSPEVGIGFCPVFQHTKEYIEVREKKDNSRKTKEAHVRGCIQKFPD
jgi:hypothetical protein